MDNFHNPSPPPPLLYAILLEIIFILKREIELHNFESESFRHSFRRIDEKHLRHEKLQTRDSDGGLRSEDTRTAGFR